MPYQNNRSEYLKSLNRMRDNYQNQGNVLINREDDNGNVGEELSAFAYVDTNIPEPELNSSNNDNSNQQIFKSNNVVERASDTYTGWVNDVLTGTLNFFDDIGDLFFNTVDAIGGGNVKWAQQARDTDWQTPVTAFMQEISYGNILPALINEGVELANTGWDFDNYLANRTNDFNKIFSGQSTDLVQQTKNNSFLSDIGEAGDFVSGVATNLGYMLPSIAVGVLTGGTSTALGATASTANAIAKGTSIGTMALGAFSNKTGEAYEETGDYGKAALTGLTSAAIEAGTEFMIPGGKALGVFGGTASKTAKDFIKSLSKTMLEEGIEEVTSAVLSPLVDTIWQGKESLKQYETTDFWLGTNGNFNDSVLGQGLAGAVSGGLLGGTSEIGNVVNQNKIYSDLSQTYGTSGAQYIMLDIDNKSLIQELNKTNEGSKTYNQIRERIAENTAKMATALNEFSKDYTSSQKNALRKYLLNPTEALQEITSQDFENELNSKINSLKSSNYIERLTSGNMFETLQRNFGTDFTISFDDNISDNRNAYIDYTNKVIHIDASLENELSSTIAHEYLGHAIGQYMSDSQLDNIYKKIVNTSWYNENSSALRRAYQNNTSYQNLSSNEQFKYWKNEIVANYIQSQLQRGTNFQSSKAISDIFANNTVFKRFLARFSKNSNLNILKNNSILNEYVNVINSLMRSNGYSFYKAFTNFVNNNMTSADRKIYEQNKELFDNAKQLVNLYASKNVENEVNRSDNNNYEKTNEFRRLQEESRKLSASISQQERVN